MDIAIAPETAAEQKLMLLMGTPVGVANTGEIGIGHPVNKYVLESRTDDTTKQLHAYTCSAIFPCPISLIPRPSSVQEEGLRLGTRLLSHYNEFARDHSRNIIGLFHLIVIHPHGRAIITSEGSKFMPFNEFLMGKNRFLMKS